MKKLLENSGIRVTGSRMMVAKALSEAGRPLSMGELEDQLETVDKSVISRTLALFREKHLVHVVSDGGDGVRYELCHSHGEHDDDVHVHFHCVKCGRTYCLEDIPVPEVELPAGYDGVSASYIVHGICPQCR